MKRRDFFKFSAVVGAVAVTGLGFENLSFAGQPPEFIPATGGGQELEARINPKTGEVELNPNIVMRNSACLGCYSSCGNRVKIDKRTGQIMRVFGNPYNPTNAEPHLAIEDPLTESYLAFSRYKDKGHQARATLCARGNATLQAHYDSYRVLVPLKRADKRGEGKWQPISWEQAVQETVEGGTPFQHLGETTPIEGLRQVYDPKTLIDPKQPDLGPKTNQLVMLGGRFDGRTVFSGRFAGAFGTRNMYTHGYS
ncbi:twin-arginine translocation signal domain-containing protein [Desulfitobacterium sp.]|uniref:twin-arginine translocation signal domain-containing protein n=1 Tax=Desulfitobacterium sp. TaxID=49981 RepID=UPI002C4011A2|nr:twin-arginine translocation signal domain-containing protein [Desulfitobacterium sp.]HVJ50796.1 twin-arginine translocation signal domain-containing protein [Desulfitobacterium sp.]